ncbi:MAG TPA: hypothetical protein VJQ58_01515 [Burkholderiales bacterium]|nr:hypothetical protein [Burkholderiales bacterium]
MFGWLDFRDVDAFADGVVADLVKRSPPAGMQMPAKKAAERLRRGQDVIFARAEAYAREKKPGFYRKARLGNRVRWALREAGYEQEFADILSEELVAVITLASR